MKKRVFLIVSIIGLLSLVSCGGGGNEQQGPPGQGGPEGPVPVPTTKVPSGDFTTFKGYATSMEGIINSDARPKVSGYITDVLVDEGQKVEEGQTLFKLETATLSEDAAAARANVNAAQVDVDQLKPLVEKDIVSESQLQSAKAKLQQAKSDYQSVMANINYATVKSPVDGVVGEIRIRQGNLVSPEDQKPLTTVADISKIYAYFTMNEKEYLNFLNTVNGATRNEKINNLPKVKLKMANGVEYEHEGTIQTVNSQIGKETGSVSFRAIFDNPEQMLTNGSTGKIEIPTKHEDIPYLPQESTFEQQGTTYVVKVKETDSVPVAQTESIEIEDSKDNFYLIKSGVEKGDEFVAKGVGDLQSGTPIKPNEVPFDSIAKPIEKVFR